MDFKFGNYYDDGINIWIVPYQNLALYRLEKESRTIELEKKLPKEYQNGCLFYGIVLYEKKIFLIPSQAEEMLIYDLNSKSWESHLLPAIKTSNDIKTKSYFYSGILYRHYIYMFGYSSSIVLRFDIETSKFEEIADINKDHTIYISNKEDGFFHVSYIHLENKIYYPFMNTNAVLVFDLTTNKSEVYEVGERGNRFISIAFDGKDFWLTPRAEGSIVKWNIETNEQCFFSNFPMRFERRMFSLYQSVYLDGYIWAFRHMGNMSLKIDVGTGEIAEFHLPYDEEEISGCRYPIVNIEKGKIRIHPGEKYEWIELDTKTNEISKFMFKKSDRCKILEKKYYFQEKQRDGYLMERDDCKLIDLLNICLLGDDYKFQMYNADSGKNIHEFVKNSLE